MKILVLNGSPRPAGNTAALVKAFAEGAESAGHSVKSVCVGTKKIGGCLGCEYCHTKGEGRCIQNDEMQEIYPLLADADMIVLAGPVYFWSFTGQLQATLTRFYAPGKPAAKKYAMILSSGSDGVYDAPIAQYKGMLAYYGVQDAGIHTFFGSGQKCEANLNKMRAFGASL